MSKVKSVKAVFSYAFSTKRGLPPIKGSSYHSLGLQTMFQLKSPSIT